MPTIEYVTIETEDTTAANQFYSTAFGLGNPVRIEESKAPTEGFRGFTLSLIVSPPAEVKALVDSALAKLACLRGRHRFVPSHNWQRCRWLHRPRRLCVEARIGVPSVF